MSGPKYIQFGDIRLPLKEQLPSGAVPVTTFWLNANTRDFQNVKFELDVIAFLLKPMTVFTSITEEMDFKFIPKKEKMTKDGKKLVYAYAKSAPFSFDFSIRDFVPLNETKTEALYVVADKGTVFTRVQLLKCQELLQARRDFLMEKQKLEAKFTVKEIPSDVAPRHQPQAVPFASLQKKTTQQAVKPADIVPSTTYSPSLPQEAKWITVTKEKAPKEKAQKPHAASPAPASSASPQKKEVSTDPAKDPSAWPDLNGRKVEAHIYQEDQLLLFAKLVKEESERQRNHQARKEASF